MKVGMVTYGSNGDVEPMVSFALELAKNNHEVDIAIISIHDRDYSFLNDVNNIRCVQKDYSNSVRVSADDNVDFWRHDVDDQFSVMDRWYKATLDQVVQYSEEFCAHCDILVGPQHLLESSCIAEKMSTPYVSLRALPAHVRSSHIEPYWLSFFQLEGMTNNEMWDLLESYENKSYKRYINRFRKQYDLPRVKNVMKEVIDSSWLNLISYSEHLHQIQDDWEPSFKLCGHFLAPSYLNWSMPQELEDFIGHDEKPILISLHSMLEYESDKDGIKNLLVDVAERLGKKVIVHSNWGQSEMVNDMLFKLDGIVDLPLLIDRCRLVVHHGGVGISHITTTQGVPSVVMKYGCDHPYNSDALDAVGVSGGSIYRNDVTVENLSDLVLSSLADENLFLRSENLGVKMRDENGARKAVVFLEEAFSTLKTNKV
ncbi:MAG: sterol 3beta-glucosyltransferase [Flavobacteriales bacterium]|jgi:sterol 3beta-glucosyltransferase